jgi:thiamine biosynthesis protein ThiS
MDKSGIQLVLNGELKPGISAATVAELVRELELPGPALLIECNGRALHRSEWEQTSLKEGDRLEFVRIVAGG